MTIINLSCSQESSSRFLHPLLLCIWAVQFSRPELLRTAEAEDSFSFSKESEITLLLTYSVQCSGATSQYPKILSPQKTPVFLSDPVVSFLTNSISRPSLLVASSYNVCSHANCSSVPVNLIPLCSSLGEQANIPVEQTLQSPTSACLAESLLTWHHLLHGWKSHEGLCNAIKRSLAFTKPHHTEELFPASPSRSCCSSYSQLMSFQFTAMLLPTTLHIAPTGVHPPSATAVSIPSYYCQK